VTVRWDLHDPKLFARLVRSFFQDKPLPEGVVSAGDYLANEAEKTIVSFTPPLNLKGIYV
jgi:hypothetical protein